MSVEVMTDVWKYSKASGSDLLVLVAIADMADDETRECWPSIGYLARKCRIKDEHHVRTIIRKNLAEKLGEVVVVENGGKASRRGGLRSNLYRITVYLPAEDESEDPTTPGHRPPSGNHDPRLQTPLDPRLQTPQTPGHRPPESSLIHQVEPSKTRGAFEDDFETVWSLYPKRVDRGKALRAYIARRRAGASAEDLLAATQHYAAAMQGTEARFIKHGATFFGPDEPFRDFVDGIPTGLAGSGQSKSMAAVDRVLASVTPPGRQELNA